MEEPLIFARKEGHVGRLTLNRPKMLHALNEDMCRLMASALLEWRDDPEVELILVDHNAETRGFCAGGDVRMLADSGMHDGAAACRFFEAEYRLNDLIHYYPKPYVSIIDGVVMGGGVGISVLGMHRVTTENTVFAMPETGIGLFPDVGGTWFLPRLEGELGTWLALTGERLKGKDVLSAGIGTHFVESEQVGALKSDLLTRGITALEKCQTSAEFSLNPHINEMNDIFALDSVKAICRALEKGSDWAEAQATKLRTKSPLSLLITLKQMQIGAVLVEFRSAMIIEYRIATRLVLTPNFHEGVRAVLIDRDFKPKWDPNSLLHIKSDYVASFFAPLWDGELTFLEAIL